MGYSDYTDKEMTDLKRWVDENPALETENEKLYQHCVNAEGDELLTIKSTIEKNQDEIKRIQHESKKIHDAVRTRELEKLLSEFDKLNDLLNALKAKTTTATGNDLNNTIDLIIRLASRATEISNKITAVRQLLN